MHFYQTTSRGGCRSERKGQQPRLDFLAFIGDQQQQRAASSQHQQVMKRANALGGLSKEEYDKLQDEEEDEDGGSGSGVFQKADAR